MFSTSDIRHFDFTMKVLLPETLVMLLMTTENISRGEADELMDHLWGV